MADFQPWNCYEAGITIGKQLKKEALYWNTFVVFITVTLFIYCWSFIFSSQNDKLFLYYMKIFEKSSPNYQKLIWIVKLPIPALSLGIIIPGYQILYCSVHFRFQIKMLQYYINNLNNELHLLELKNITINTKFQKEIKKRLCFCLRRYSHLYRYLYFKNIFMFFMF